VRGAGDESEVGANVSAKVRAKVTEHFLGEKIQVFTYKPKKTFKKKHGHRSRLSRLAIESISVKERKESKSGA
jgi:large subunit ribosomal protein L21